MRARIWPSLALVVLAACGSTGARTATLSPARVDASALTELMSFEDTRTYDSAAFTRLATAGNWLTRQRTMLAMGRIGNTHGIPLLLEALSDPSDSVRTYAAFALGELADSAPRVTQALGALSAGRGVAAAEALAALGKIGGAGARLLVEKSLRRHKRGIELEAALLAAWRFPRRSTTNAWIAAHARSRDRETRWRAVYALVRAGVDPALVREFLRLVEDPDPLVRSIAARGLRFASADSAGQSEAAAIRLRALLRDPDAHVRINAATMLSGYRQAASASHVLPLLDDPDLNVRIAAMQALGALGGADAAHALEEKVQDTSEKSAIRGIALVSLAAADPGRALLAARVLSTSKDAALRSYVARALGNTSRGESLELLRSLARDSDPRVQLHAITSLSDIAVDTLVSARAFFIEQLGTAEPYSRAAALTGLARLARPGDEVLALEAFERSLQDRIEEPGQAALSLLAKLAENNPAIRRSFTTRFPLGRIPLVPVRRAAVRALKIAEPCCALVPQPELYARVVRTVLAPALKGNYKPRAKITTEAGVFEVELLAADAPITVDNFITLARRKYFDGGRWHRVVPNFVLQDGDPTGTGEGGPGYAIRDEINRVRYLDGILGMALSGPDTGGSQWFITHSPQPHLDGTYTVFGRVVSGMTVAQRVVQDDRIASIEIVP